MELVANIVALMLLLTIVGLYIAGAAWAVGDAHKRGYSGGLVVLLLWLFGPFGMAVWLMVRPTAKVAARSAAQFTNPEDMLAAAFQLDMEGEWDAASALYGNAAERWPEHAAYARECIERIEGKRSRT